MSEGLEREVDIYLKIGDKIDFLWTRYIYVNAIAIFGLSAVDFWAAWPVKSLGFGFYLIFCYMNYRALVNNYSGLRDVAKGVSDQIDAANVKQPPKSMQWLKTQRFDHRVRDTQIIFAFGLVAIFVAMLSGAFT